MKSFSNYLVLIGLISLCGVRSSSAAESEAALQQRMTRGKLLYVGSCLMCHQAQGQGTPGSFPPLANSDFIRKDRERSIKAVCEGLAGTIQVNGQTYNGFMPPAVLNDEQTADVLTYVFQSWGNSNAPVTASEVREVRKKTQFKTYEELKAANEFQPLPKPPAGWALREVARLQQHATRLASDGTGRVLYALGINGDVWRVDVKSGSLKQILFGTRYLDLKLGEPFIVGFTMDSQKRLWIVSNQRNETIIPHRAEVIIYRTSQTIDGEPANPVAWYRTHYPWGTGNHHGVGHIDFGPDGMLYVTSGSRTDGNDPALDDPKISHEGETPLTACIWRFDPKAEKPELQIYAEGLRNAYGFCWDDKGRMFATENGPNADAPEELNLIEQGKHYGFPYKYSNWEKKVYPHTPEPPPGAKFVQPIVNNGPDACRTGKPLYTFDPHSSPSGIVFLGSNKFPEGYRGSFLVGRFGILLPQPEDYGFDLLKVRVTTSPSGESEATVEKILAPLARPVDVHMSGDRIFICEYTRTITFKGSTALPGRILEFYPTLQ